jgi:hypothetical protein
MRSPFPGMDPYLEDPAFWMDFHESFLIYLRDALNSRLPDDYETRIEERVSLVRQGDEESQPSQIRADVAVSARRDFEWAPAGQSTSTGGVATLEPITIPLPVFDDVHQSFIKILHRPDEELVTVIELLSPVDKLSGADYPSMSRLNVLATSRVHLVELDLLVGGCRMPFGEPLPPADYFAFVSRGNRRPDCSVFAWNVRDPLPKIPIPLLAPDADVPLDLAKLFCTTFERGRYRRSLRYGAPPAAPLSEKTRNWAVEVARTAAQVHRPSS